MARPAHVLVEIATDQGGDEDMVDRSGGGVGSSNEQLKLNIEVQF